jgi:thiamine biosynthesis protein ThiS
MPVPLEDGCINGHAPACATRGFAASDAPTYNPRVVIKVNGAAREVAAEISVDALLADLNLTPDKVAIELNRRLLRGDRYATALQDGDEIEIVTFVGGG